MQKKLIDQLKILANKPYLSPFISRDYAYCAIATKLDHIIHRYKVVNFDQVDSWKLLQLLKEHSQTISDIDWPQNKKIVTNSHDRSVVV